MKLQLSLLTGLVASGAIAMGATPASAFNIVTNGGFEATQPGDLNRGSWGIYDAIQGWKATPGGKIEVQRNAAGKAYEGSNLVELDSHDYDVKAPVLGLFQDLVTTPGQLYTLSFAYSARPNTAANDNGFSVLFGDKFKQTIQDGAGGRQTNWNIFTVDVLATSALTRLQFNYEGPRNTLGAYIDDVKVNTAATPEPTTMAGIALAGLGLAARKKLQARRNKAVA